MLKLSGKKVILCITGGIAAYKTPDLIRRLREQGTEVRVILTETAKRFVAPLSIKIVSGNPVFDNALCEQSNMEHIELARWPDLILVAPATANLIAHLAAGMANDLITTTCLATVAPIALIPSMNQQMYHANVTKMNLEKLRSYGFLTWGPEFGNQACGDVGLGRMLDPNEILGHVLQCLHSARELDNLNIMITAGPTREAIDPVWYISNYSSGKMGFAIAESAAARGANVTLITGPVNLEESPLVKRVDVKTALEMESAVMAKIDNQHIFIASAAVVDYRASAISDNKIKKDGKNQILMQLDRNPDIVKKVAALDRNRPYTVGFAAETQNLEQYAQEKYRIKKLDLICANDVSKAGQGFGSDTNAMYMFWGDGEKYFPLDKKVLLGQQLLDEIISRYDKSNQYQDS